jgi:hypothetical protein
MIDLTGQRFGRLMVLEQTAERRQGKVVWRCLCNCGQESLVATDKLRGGTTRSCGCLKREDARARMTTHGHTAGGARSSEFGTWCSMRRRCQDPAVERYPRYGGRGITVCDRWDKSFEAFFADMGPRPSPEHSIERYENDGNYEPGNCGWELRPVQQRNREDRRTFAYNGEQLLLSEIARGTGINLQTLWKRINSGWPENRWFEPVKK